MIDKVVEVNTNNKNNKICMYNESLIICWLLWHFQLIHLYNLYNNCISDFNNSPMAIFISLLAPQKKLGKIYTAVANNLCSHCMKTIDNSAMP